MNNFETNLKVAYEVWLFIEFQPKQMHSVFPFIFQFLLQGFARMASEIGSEKSQDWGCAVFGGVFKVEWIRKESIPFQFAHHLLNPWNDNKKVQISRDSQVMLFSLLKSFLLGRTMYCLLACLSLTFISTVLICLLI